MVLRALKAEFQMSKFLYNYHDDRVFYCSHWKIPPPIFAAIRVLLSLYSIFALTYYLVVNALHPRGDHNVMVYFTCWSYITLTLHLALAALISVLFCRRVNYDIHATARAIYYRNTNGTPHAKELIPQSSFNGSQNSESSERNAYDSALAADDVTDKIGSSAGPSLSSYESIHGDHSYERQLSRGVSTRWFFIFSWILADLNLCAAPIVTCVYFAAIYPDVHKKKGGGVSLQDTNIHILNFVFAVFDFILSARPVRVFHSWVPVFYGLCWVIFSAIYWAADPEKHIIYKMANWNKSEVALCWMFGLFTAMPLIMTMYFALYWLKIRLYSALFKENYFISVY